MAKHMSVTIAKRNYTISTDESQEYVDRLAALVSEKIREVSGNSDHSPLDATTIAALALADELLKERAKKQYVPRKKPAITKTVQEPLF